MVLRSAASVPGRMRVHVGRRRCPGESRVDVDDLRPVFLGLPDPLEGHGMVLCHIAALHQNRLAMLEVNPVGLVIAPRPNAAPRPGTVGLCQSRAWCSTKAVPSRRAAFWKR